MRAIAFNCYEKARETLRQHRPLMDRLVDLLLEQETMDGEQFRKIVSDYTKIPEEKLSKAPITA